MKIGPLGDVTYDVASRWLRYFGYVVLGVGGIYFAFVDGDLLLGVVSFGVLVGFAESIALRREVRELRNRTQE